MKTEFVVGDPRTLTLAKVNARYMRHEMFATLVANIKADGCLTQAPFVWKDENEARHVLSGNHRVSAAIEAGLTEITWQETSDPLDSAQRIAIQLSHNAISGEDDPALLAALYEEIDDLGMRLYTGLDDRMLDLMAEADVGNLTEVNLEFQNLTLHFLPDEWVATQKAFEAASELAKGADHRWLSRMEDHVRLLDALTSAGSAYNVRNMAAAMTFILDIFARHQTDLAEGWYDPETEQPYKRPQSSPPWIPLVTIIGNDYVPPAAAAVIKQAVDKMLEKDELSSKARWQALEFWAAEYLAQP